MIKPEYLKKGDTIAIVAPGRKLDKDVIQYASKVIQSWGLTVSLSRNLFSNSHSYLAGSDAERMADFQQALDDDRVKAIICARGGYGSTRIVDQLNYAEFKKHPKWIVGFSDITAFHLKLFSEGYQSIHATMPVLFSNGNNETSVESLHKLLFGGSDIFQVVNDGSNRAGAFSGEVVGGNLSLLVDAIGTSSQPDLTNKILIVEEISEYLYKTDRMFMQLKRAGMLKQLGGLIIGHFTDVLDTELNFGETIKEIILRAVHEYNFPVGFNFPTGHDTPNLAWRSGGMATLEVNNTLATLIFND